MAEKCQRLHKSTVGHFWFHFFQVNFFREEYLEENYMNKTSVSETDDILSTVRYTNLRIMTLIRL